MIDLLAIQVEQVEWSNRNFGVQPARMPIMGMIEELLEFDTAWYLKEDARAERSQANGDPVLASKELDTEMFDATELADVLDAIGDIAIYMLDYCGRKGLQLNDLWNERIFLNERSRSRWSNLAPLAQRLAHHSLKREQGIRGAPEVHDLAIRQTCCAILAHLEFICRYLRQDFLLILDSVWSKVRLRDWTKNKNNAHEVAEALHRSST